MLAHLKKLSPPLPPACLVGRVGRRKLALTTSPKFCLMRTMGFPGQQTSRTGHPGPDIQDIRHLGHQTSRTSDIQDIRYPGHQISRTSDIQDIRYPGHQASRTVFSKPFLGQKLPVLDVWCPGCLMYWMSDVLDVWCPGCLMSWMSDVPDVWCPGCLMSRMSYVIIWTTVLIYLWWSCFLSALLCFKYHLLAKCLKFLLKNIVFHLKYCIVCCFCLNDNFERF